ncbi:MAG: sulfotransferase [Candidatus Desulfofervidus auxilii]|nr:sulfotransferase [Candidatus Desulfofervidus auxilii]
MNSKKPPIFILGTQRSGTTLLRLILNSHSKIAIPEEAEFLRPLLKYKYFKKPFYGESLKRIYNYLRNSPHFHLWNYDYSDFLENLKQQKEITLKELIESLYLSYAKHEGKIIWGDKTPSLFRKIKLLYQLFPEAKFIHIVRDGRDVFDSWRKMDPTKNNVAVVALEWQYKNYKIEKFLKYVPNSNKMRIRYEDLLMEPQEVLKKICFFLNINYESEILNFYKKSKYYIGSHHSELIFKPISPQNIYKWKKTLNSYEIKAFTFLAKRYLKIYNYEIECSKMCIKEICFLFRDLFIGIPLRMLQVVRANLLFNSALKGKKVKFKVGSKPASK